MRGNMEMAKDEVARCGLNAFDERESRRSIVKKQEYDGEKNGCRQTDWQRKKRSFRLRLCGGAAHLRGSGGSGGGVLLEN